MTDYLRELHQIDPGEDLPSDAECIAECEDTIRRLEAGDTALVPPWLTLEETLEQAKAELERYRR
jgi:hypothetical protein